LEFEAKNRSVLCVKNIYSQAPSHPDEILKLIARTPTGRSLLEPFLALYRSGQVRLEPYPASLVERLRAVLGEGQPIGACFVADGTTGTIHFDLEAPLGILGPFILHEIAHSLDPSLWHTARTAQTRRTRDQTMLKAETRAFEAQHRFVQELQNADPEFKKFLKSQQARVRILTERMNEKEIASLYGLH
jgi:hypothetical protein